MKIKSKTFSFSLKIVFTLFIVFLFLFFSALSYSNTISNDIASNVLRLHVIANSDTEEDQNLKYMVRDTIINYMKSLTQYTNSKEDAIYIMQEHLEDFKNIAQETVSQNGFDYPVEVEIGNYDFPTKSYGDISLPAGYYDALRIKIGNSRGQNWWCVMFPPLCFVDISSGVVPQDSIQHLQEELATEDYSIISEDSDIFILKFKIVELINNFSIKLTKME